MFSVCFNWIIMNNIASKTNRNVQFVGFSSLSLFSRKLFDGKFLSCPSAHQTQNVKRCLYFQIHFIRFLTQQNSICEASISENARINGQSIEFQSHLAWFIGFLIRRSIKIGFCLIYGRQKIAYHLPSQSFEPPTKRMAPSSLRSFFLFFFAGLRLISVASSSVECDDIKVENSIKSTIHQKM